MYNPHEIYSFLTSQDLKSILGKSFYKRHMEDDAIKSPFDTPEEIYMLEHLIANGYIIAEYRNDQANDSESYLISTMGHAFVRNYKKSRFFRLNAYLSYVKHLHWILFASMMGSLMANYLFAYFHEY